MSNDLGIDRSGNNNTWTVNNLTFSDQVVDSPTNNFCTYNALALKPNMAVTLSEGNLKNGPNSTHAGSPHDAVGTTTVTTGKWYFESLFSAAYGGVGIVNLDGTGVSAFLNNTGNPFASPFSDYEGWGFQAANGNKEHAASNVSFDSAIAANDIIMTAFDMDAGKIWWGKNGTWLQSGDPAAGSNEAYAEGALGFGLAAPAVNAVDSNYIISNFGQDSSFAGNKTAQGNQDGNDIGDFYYEPPTDFLALCTSNLPAVAVTPSEHFDAIKYAGDAASTQVLTTTFEPDFIWNKTDSYHHRIYDRVRGFSNQLNTNANYEENKYTDFGHPTATSSTSLTFGQGTDSGNLINASGADGVFWLLKANGAGSANTDGNMAETVTVSANTDAGFSIVTYTGDGATGTVGHGLGAVPEMIVVKKRNAAAGWITLHHKFASDYETDGMDWDASGAVEDLNTFWNDTKPTSSVFTVSTFNGNNADDSTYVAYCFRSIEGFSKVGSYEGNNNADGTFVYTGFRPAFIIRKRLNATSHWHMVDKARDGFNGTGSNDVCFVNTTTAPSGTDTDRIDLLSNGFKVRTTDGDVNDTSTIIYIAFAETPFKYSNAR